MRSIRKPLYHYSASSTEEESSTHKIGAVCRYSRDISGMTKGGALLVVVQKGLTMMVHDAIWLLLTISGEFYCQMIWQIATLAVLSGSAG